MNVSDAVNNLCTLEYHGQEENYESLCNESESGDTTEDYSIIPDKYSNNPGKQRLFDLRLVKPPFHAKYYSVSDPFMNRIEEITSPIVPKNLNPYSVLNNVSHNPSEIEKNSEASLVVNTDCSSSGVKFNHLSDITSDNGLRNSIDNTEKSIIMNMEVDLTDSSVEDKIMLSTLNFTMNHRSTTNNPMDIMPKSLIYQNHVGDEKKSVAIEIETKLANSESIQLNKSLNNSNIGMDKFDLMKSMCIIFNANVHTMDHYNSAVKSEALANETKSMNPSVLDATFDDICTNKLLTNIESNTNKSEHFSYAAELKKSVTFDPKLIIPAINSKETLLSELNKINSQYSTNSDVNYLEEQSSIRPQYLNFDQSQIEKRKAISSASVNSTLNEFEDYCIQLQDNISVTEQSICPDTTDPGNIDDSFSILDDHLKLKLPVINEKTTLKKIMVKNNDGEKVVYNMSSNSVSENVLSEDTNDEMVCNLATEVMKEVIYNVEDNSNIHGVGLPLMNVTNPLKIETANENNFIDQSIIDSGLSFYENQDTVGKIILDNCYLSINDKAFQNETNIVTNGQYQLDCNTSEQDLFRDTEKKDWNPNSLSKNNLTNISILNTSELFLKSDNTLENIIHQDHVLNTTDSTSSKLAEINKIEKMLLEEDKKVVEFKTLKKQNILDFSIKQSPYLVSQGKKQELLDVSVVEQTSPSKSKQHISFNHNFKKANTPIAFSPVGQMLDFGIMSGDEIDKEFEKYSSKKFMNISAPNVELLANMSVKSNSDHSDLSFYQTISETNLNNTDNIMNVLKMEDPEQFSKKDNSLVSINKQIEVNKSSITLNKIISQNKSYEEQCMKESTTEEHKYGPEILLITAPNTESVMDSNQKSVLNSNKYSIEDFSIVEQSKVKIIETITSAESDNSSNHIDLSIASISNIPSNKQFVLPNTTIIDVSSSDESEKTLNKNCSNDTNYTVINFGSSQFVHNEGLTDVQMKDISLFVETPDKSLLSDSLHSIELDSHVQKYKRTNIESLQEFHNKKKIKIDDEKFKTPSSK